jgi:chaperone modulatory protein CbpM
MTMSKQEFLQSAGIDTQTVEFWLEQQWLLPEPTPAGPSFSDREIARARFIVDLKSTFQVNDEAIDVILHLVDQIHGLRYAIAQLRSGIPRRSAESSRDGNR